MSTRTHSRKRKTVVVSLWVSPSIKAEIKRLAEKDGLSVSKYAGSLLEEGLHQQLHIQHAVLLQPLIEQAISKRMAAISTRLSSLMVRGVLDTGQVRRLVINLLARQPGMTQQTLEEILDGSHEGARKQITHMTPQLATLIAEVEKWLLEPEEGGKN
jgi:RecB family endonuclease NucS